MDIWDPESAPTDYLQRHPPQHVKPFVRAADAQLLDTARSEYGSHITAYKIVCTCGHDVFAVDHDYFTEDGQRIATGCLRIHCSECGREITLFDPRSHGYDGMMGNDLYEDDADGRMAVSCSKCGHDSLRIHVAFQFGGDGPTTDEVDNISDYYSWFVSYVGCVGCGEVQEILSAECA